MDEKLQKLLALTEQRIRAIVSTLPQEEQDKIDAKRQQFHTLATEDSGQVALVLFQLEAQAAGPLPTPYGGTFDSLGEIPEDLYA